MPIITLLTDFGSLYPAQMKGAILSRIPEATIVDIAHDIPPQNIEAGAFALMATAVHFPLGTIHVAVVDPGVGTDRAGVIVESGGHLLVGPDNGLLLPAARALGKPKAWKIGVGPRASPTFHGRDIFAPIAALLASGRKPESLGEVILPIDLDYGVPIEEGRRLRMRVIYVDRFGNAVLNCKQIPWDCVCLKGRHLRRKRTYAQARAVEPLIIQGSHGHEEIAVNQGSAAELFDLAPGDEIVLEEGPCSKESYRSE